MAHDPEYRAGRRMRLSGILVASVGGGTGLALTLVGLMTLLTESVTYGFETSGSDSSTGAYLTTAGLTTLVLSLAVGLPLTFVGHGRVKRARRRHLRFHAGVLPGGGVAGLTWRF